MSGQTKSHLTINQIVQYCIYCKGIIEEKETKGQYHEECHSEMWRPFPHKNFKFID